ncbi:MAG: hypothetical protein GTO67_14455 [Gammaproteobacteria bacterium]|nr:hypothetical protein [Gammaproteobacteria bacterium]NIM74974.1 hypothetical protein [Gammaproteobacteria bacterium]NIN39763.1 hypothetical protein [Gammaproteobacteria bacterium]NIO26891.1 hypothetical protein [Gammaproteobacteria bacterium]NIO67447.1 hypothetical protein [Gammaproteobacteria bacterium]
MRPDIKAGIDQAIDGSSSSEAHGTTGRALSLARAIPYGEVSRYSQLAVLSAGMNLGLPVLLHESGGIAERTAVALTLATAFIVNFIAARSYVFKASGAFTPQMLRFAAASAGFRIAEYMAFLFLHTFFGLFYVLAIGVVLLISFGVKFVFYRSYVFAPVDNGWATLTATQLVTLLETWSQPPRAAAKAFVAADALLFGALFAYFLFYPHTGFEGVIPDNIAQTAYWSLLTRPELVGSIGSSSPKGGLIVLLGSAHLISYEIFESTWPFKAMLAAFFAATLFLIYRIAMDFGGPIAGLLAVLVAMGSTYLPQTFYTGSSNLFFLPLVLLGLLLLSKSRDRPAVMVLGLAATIRPEALIIIGMVVVHRYLRRGDWRKSIEFSAYGAIAFVFFVLMAYWSQGSWDRIGGGAATGYPAFASLQTVEHLRVTVGQFFSERFVTLLLLPAVFSLIRMEYARAYLYFYAMALAFIFLVIIDFFGMHYRYIAAGQVIIFALGCGGLMQIYAYIRRPSLSMPGTSTIVMGAAATAVAVAVVFWSTRDPTTCLMLLAFPTSYLLAAVAKHRTGSDRLLIVSHIAIALFVAAAPIASAVKARQAFGTALDTHHPAILDALEFLGDPRIPPGSAVIAEDELLNYVLVKRPDFFSAARSIQSFNVMTDTQRREALSKTQFLYVSKRQNYGWNYLFYLPRATWVTDPFRTIVLEMIRTNQPRTVFGSTLEPIYNSDTRFIARIRPDSDGEPGRR